jgi:radical SAM protein with 4Fe4S-binding SPASM domain
VLDLAERFPDCFFVMYTNGTLVDEAVAKRLGRLGNVSPALSIEGMRERTDARRGEGVFDKVLAAMERLRREGVITGVSLTATRLNSDEILSDEVVETFFDGLGASYAFVFHYMPMGRSFTLELMMTPEQRLRLFERVWWLVRNRHLFITDFWNSATATNGCLAAGRAGGYFHVNWNGDVSPCVFFPYTPVNVKEVFARGGTLDDVWAHPFFADIRRWQRKQGYREAGEACPDCSNWMAPCIIRDHHGDFVELMRRHEPSPLDEDARAALADPEYHAGLERFGRELEELTGPVWRERYREGKGTPSAPMKRL